jgi:hypothetical protein
LERRSVKTGARFFFTDASPRLCSVATALPSMHLPFNGIVLQLRLFVGDLKVGGKFVDLGAASAFGLVWQSGSLLALCSE